MSREDRKEPANWPAPRTTQGRRYSAWDLEKIRELAYASYSARLGSPGDALTDWLEAERMFLWTPEAAAALATPSPPIKALLTTPSETGLLGRRELSESLAV